MSAMVCTTPASGADGSDVATGVAGEIERNPERFCAQILDEDVGKSFLNSPPRRPITP